MVEYLVRAAKKSEIRWCISPSVWCMFFHYTRCIFSSRRTYEVSYRERGHDESFFVLPTFPVVGSCQASVFFLLEYQVPVHMLLERSTLVRASEDDIRRIDKRERERVAKTYRERVVWGRSLVVSQRRIFVGREVFTVCVRPPASGPASRFPQFFLLKFLHLTSHLLLCIPPLVVSSGAGRAPGGRNRQP